MMREQRNDKRGNTRERRNGKRGNARERRNGRRGNARPTQIMLAWSRKSDQVS